MLIFKMSSFYHFGNVLVKISLNWIVLKSTLKGLLKNVQDGTSKCIGGQEISKRKVETILRDAL